MKKLYLIILLFILSITLYNCKKSNLHIVVKQNWEAVTPAINLGSTNDLTDISFFDDNSSIISGTYGILIKTTDGWKTWQRLSTNTNISLTSCFMQSSTNYFTGRYTFLQSTNGASFTSLNSLPNNTDYISAIKFTSATNGFVIKTDTLYKTTNGGISFTPIYKGYYINKMQFTSTNIGYLAGGITFGSVSNGSMYKTIDGGNTWIDLGINSKEITALYFVSDDVGYFSNFSGDFFKTTNGGSSWAKTTTITNEYITGIVFTNELNGFACSYSGEIYKTDNGAVKFNQDYEANSTITKIVKTPVSNSLYAIGNDGMILKRKK